MKKVLKWVAVVVGVLVLVCCGAVLLLPRDWNVEASVVIDAPKEEIYPIFATPRKWVMVVDRFARTQPDYENSTFKYTFGDVPEGPGAWWISETEGPGPKSRVRIEYTKGGPEEGLWYDGMIESDEVNDHGSVLLETVEGGTRVTWTDTGTVSYAMGGGITAKFLSMGLGPFFGGILEELKTVVEQDVEIVEAE